MFAGVYLANISATPSNFGYIGRLHEVAIFSVVNQLLALHSRPHYYMCLTEVIEQHFPQIWQGRGELRCVIACDHSSSKVMGRLVYLIR